MFSLGMTGRVCVLAAITLLFAAGLSAQPPYSGYANSVYSNTGVTGDWVSSMWLKQGSTTLMQNLSQPESSTDNLFWSGVTPAQLAPGTQYTLQLQTGNATWSEGLMAWIDYNNDGDFYDSGEAIGYYPSLVNSSTIASINFTPPSTASGFVRLRIRCVYYVTPPFDPVTSQTYGQTDDYILNLGFSITTPSPLASAAQNSAYNKSIQAANGTVPYTWNTSISGLPAGITASQVNNDLVLSGTPTSSTAVGQYTFTVNVTDSSSPAKQAQKTYVLNVVPPPASMPFLDTFANSNLGWQLGTTWSIGAATAYAPTSTPPRSEPGTDATAGTTDNKILGDTIGGDYPASLGATYYAVSPMVNCSAASTVRVRFWRWLGCSIGTTASIEVSNNGTTWSPVWSSTQSSSQTTIRDTVWTSVFYDITSVAAGSATVQVRFSIGPTSSTIHTGWCIDDFQIEEPGPDLEVREGGVTGTLITDDQAVGGLRDFGQVNVSTQSTPLTIAMTNVGPTTIDVSSGITKSGANPADFYINASAFPASIAVGQTATFTVTFYRTTQGVSTAKLSIAHNASGSGTTPFEINLMGEAIQPIPVIEVHLSTAGGTIIPHQDPATGTIRDFGNQDVSAGATTPITIFIVNSGTGSLGLSTPDMGGTWWDQYIVNTTGMPSILAPGASTSFTVAFDPNSVGSKDAYVRIPHTDGAQPTPYYVPVLGNGTSPGPTLNLTEGSATGPSFVNGAAASGGRDFGFRLVSAGPTAALTISVNNTGTGTMTVGTPTLGGADPGEFVLNTTGMTSPVMPGNSTTFTIAFDPSSAGQKDATVSFTHNDTNTATPFIINVTGVGTLTSGVVTVRETNASGAALTNPAPASGVLDFGGWDINSGPSAPATIYVENTGTGPLTVGAPVFNPASSDYQIQATGFAGVLAVGASATFTITFDPSAIVAGITATIEFTHDDPTSGNPFVLNVTGDGILNSPLVQVHEGSAGGTSVASGAPAQVGGGRDCGSINVTAGATAPITLFIVNAGTLDMTVASPSITGVNAADFTLNTGGFTTVIPPGGAATVSITFDPILGGMKDAQFEFVHDDSTQPSPFIVPLIGTAVDPNGVQITTASVPSGTAGVVYETTTFTAVQGSAPYTWSLYTGNLPPGITITPAGVLQGTPTGYGGQFKFRIRVTDATGATNEKQFAMTVVSSLAGRGRAKGGGCASTSDAGLPLALLGLLATLVAGVRFHTRRRA
ncbi:MAG: choice-of-anchor D domain-containing protein [Planctomycetes bacterium]|nr:choice-of-anchor D domain-containing protein [Planctomycetota bacterium]